MVDFDKTPSGDSAIAHWIVVCRVCAEKLLNAIVSWLMEDHHYSHRHEIHQSETSTFQINDRASKQNSLSSNPTTHNDVEDLAERDLEMGSPCCSGHPINQLEKGNRGLAFHHEPGSRTSNGMQPEDSTSELVIEDCFCNNLAVAEHHQCCEEKDSTHPISVAGGSLEHHSSSSDDEIEQQDDERGNEVDDPDKKKRLAKMGMTTALAVALHNFPEGIATFVAALNDPKVGAVLAIAIAVHNIPEGLCIAPPIFYATGNRTKAFLWALLSGAAELVAAFFACLY